MAKGLQCPACGHQHRLDTLPGTPTFHCAECGRALRTPEGYVHAPGARSNATPAPTTVLEGLPPSTGSAQQGADPKRPHEPTHLPGAMGHSASVVLRLGVWVAAIALGGLISFAGARAVHWITSQRLVDVITGNGYGRYLRVMALVPVWALISALIAQGLIEGIRALAARRAGAAARRPQVGPEGGARRDRALAHARPAAPPTAPPAQPPTAPAAVPPASPAAPRAPVPAGPSQRRRRIGRDPAP